MPEFNEVEINISGNLLKHVCFEKAVNDTNYVYEDRYNDSYRTIRFTTKTLIDIFGMSKNNSGIFNNGYKAMYEVTYASNKINLICLIDIDKIDLNVKNYILEDLNGNILLKIESECDLNDIEKTFNNLLDNEVKEFEDKLNTIFNKNIEPSETYYSRSDLDEDFFIEGSMIQVVSNRYERNRKARQKCLDFYGYKCQICGLDFKEKYGDDFANIIQVHHIVPISEIKEDYKVDPIKDLIPVCPNCHVALHSKKNGVYTPDELKEFLNKK